MKILIQISPKNKKLRHQTDYILLRYNFIYFDYLQFVLIFYNLLSEITS